MMSHTFPRVLIGITSIFRVLFRVLSIFVGSSACQSVRTLQQTISVILTLFSLLREHLGNPRQQLPYEQDCIYSCSQTTF